MSDPIIANAQHAAETPANAAPRVREAARVEIMRHRTGSATAPPTFSLNLSYDQVLDIGRRAGWIPPADA